MEGNESRPVVSSQENSEIGEEADLWTFVNREDFMLGNKDLIEDCDPSGQDSDGSSIVVLESACCDDQVAELEPVHEVNLELGNNITTANEVLLNELYLNECIDDSQSNPTSVQEQVPIGTENIPFCSTEDNITTEDEPVREEDDYPANLELQLCPTDNGTIEMLENNTGDTAKVIGLDSNKENALQAAEAIPIMASVEEASNEVSLKSVVSSEEEYSSSSELEAETWEFSTESGSPNTAPSSLNYHIQIGSYAVPKPDLLEEANRIEELDQMDYSTLTNQDLPVELNIANINRERHYVHHPNQRLNVLLSFVVAFSLAAVVGFGLGHFIGLSDNYPPRPGCTHSNEAITSDRFEGWTEADWKAELQRISNENIQLRRVLEEKEQYCVSEKQNDLLSENMDLKHTISRIRYGKPVRSLEDRNTINQLETENQELRTLVGKLRYSCLGSRSSDSSEYRKDDPFLNIFTINATNLWDQFFNDKNGWWNETQRLPEQLVQLQQTTSEFLNVIYNHWIELNNITQKVQKSGTTSKMKETLNKSIHSFIDVMGHLFISSKDSLSSVASNLIRTTEEIKGKLKERWRTLKQKVDEKPDSEKPSQSYKSASRERPTSMEGESSLNEDWFLQLGQTREARRKKQHESEWQFERAKAREKGRSQKGFDRKDRDSFTQKRKATKSNTFYVRR